VTTLAQEQKGMSYFQATNWQEKNLIVPSIKELDLAESLI
jgi:hypothetical protein